MHDTACAGLHLCPCSHLHLCVSCLPEIGRGCRAGAYGLGVADGVYMWRDQGIDAGDLARTLMSSASDAVSGGMRDVLHGEQCKLR